MRSYACWLRRTAAGSDRDGGGGGAAAAGSPYGGGVGRPPPSHRGRVAALLRGIAQQRGADPPEPLASPEFWRPVLGLAPRGAARGGDDGGSAATAACAAAAADLATEVARRGYAVCGAPTASRADLAALVASARRLRDAGFPPAALLLADALWDAVLPAFDAARALLGGDCVMDESAFVFALDARVAGGSGGSRRCGGNFPLPHRDFTFDEAVDATGRPRILSVWIPLTDATTMNGCLYIVRTRARRAGGAELTPLPSRLAQLPRMHDALWDQPRNESHMRAATWEEEDCSGAACIRCGARRVLATRGRGPGGVRRMWAPLSCAHPLAAFRCSMRDP